MGKNSGKKKAVGTTSGDSSPKLNKVGDSSPRGYDKDAEVFISMAHELKEEGNKLFQKRDHEGAMVKYGKALKLLPKNHIEVSHLRSNMAACYMQMGLSEYPRAINECNLALEVTPKYSKALLKRSRCFEAMNRLDLAFRDVSAVLQMEPQNVMALEIAERVKAEIESKGLRVNESVIELPPDYVEPPGASPSPSLTKVKTKKKKGKRVPVEKTEENVNGQNVEENVSEDKDEGKKLEENLVEEKKNPTNVPSEKVDGQKLKEKIAEDKVEEKKLEGNGGTKKKRNRKVASEKTEGKMNGEKADKDKVEEMKVQEIVDDNKDEVKMVVEEKITSMKGGMPEKTVKLVFGEDIRWAQLPTNCSLLQLRDVIRDRFPSLGAVLVKYRDQEGDLVTITTNEELRWAEASAESQGSVRLYIVEVDPEQDQFFQKIKIDDEACNISPKKYSASENENYVENRSVYIEDWIIEFAQLFKNHAGFESDAYMNIHELGMKLYSETLEETVTSEEAQGLFDIAAEKFQELAALALFNWGNVHMSRARKKVYFPEDASKEAILFQIKNAYDWAQKEYKIAGMRYEEALKIKPDFYEGTLALAQQQFEQAKLSWYYAISSNVDIETWPSAEVLQLYNNAEENMEKGIRMWEESEKQHSSEISKPDNIKTQLQNMGLEGLLKNISADEAKEQAAKVKSLISLLWGTMLYERSIMEFKLGLPVWHESLEVAVEKFELAGASQTDIAVMVKNHCSNDTAAEGLGFKIDEIVQAWNDMYEAKHWQSGVLSFRLESLLRRRVSKLYHALEHT